jgi:hypothetical protein
MGDERIGIGEKGFRLPRRRLVGVAAAAAGLSLMPRLAEAGAPPLRSLAFGVWRKGDRIGQHTVDFTPKGNGFQVDVNIDLRVKMAFITVFSYQQQGRDVWQDGVMVSTRVNTVDDGKKFEVTATAGDGKLQVAGPNGALTLPLGTMTDLSFWNDGILRSKQLLDTQYGQVGHLTANAGSPETIAVRGQQIKATRYAVVSSEGRAGDIWYDGDGQWVKAIITTRGETLDYRLT